MRDSTGINYYQGGPFTPSAAVIQPAMFVSPLTTGLVAKGVRTARQFIWNARAIGRWRPGFASGYPEVILAVNGHINSFGFMKNRLMLEVYLSSADRRDGV